MGEVYDEAEAVHLGDEGLTGGRDAVVEGWGDFDAAGGELKEGGVSVDVVAIVG